MGFFSFLKNGVKGGRGQAANRSMREHFGKCLLP